MPDDVRVMHDALTALRRHKKGEPLTLNLKNCGTALRFLEVHLAQCYSDEPITLTGDARLMERKGKPTSQTTSALILHGIDVPVEPDESPYVTMTREVARKYKISNGKCPMETCWSSASFWYEYIAIHGGELLLAGLTPDSLQGDRVVADIFAEFFGVETTFTPEGAIIKKSSFTNHQSSIALDFSNCPDLYPPIALTCECLGYALQATGTERLPYKESDRLEAVRLHEVRNDHRMAMALMAADYIQPLPASSETKELEKCIAKSYPAFVEQLSGLLHDKDGNDTATTRQRHGNESRANYAHIVPKRGVNDDNLGKKHALSKLIHAAKADYVWLHDDDVVWPNAAKKPNLTFPKGNELTADLYILPLRMESSLPSGRGGVGLLPLLQIAEYAAIQELTMRTAQRGHAVMCSGANMIVRREAWLACESEIHPEIPSGDDMFLLEAMKRHGYKIGVIDEPDFTAIVRPQTTWRAFWRQRMRWAGKAPHYTDRDIRRCGALVAAANILQIFCPPVILIKFPIEYRLIKKREPQTSWLVALLLEIVYPFYLLISLVGGLSRQHSW
jgi:5-enolpyruvylshikimate-3-phosphate synthase